MDYVKLSKELSYALRHAPWEYELELDNHGFVPVQQLIDAINENGRYDRPVTLNDLIQILEKSDKKRHELQGDKIRALYGHSVPTRISKEIIVPPEVLYHGAPHKALGSIMRDGLKPMGRQYVHLSVDSKTAVQVGKRKDENPVILIIEAANAHNNGVTFYQGNAKVVLADYVPHVFIQTI